MDIHLFSTDELIQELSNRYDTIILAGYKHDFDAQHNSLYTRKWKGNNTTCTGLCSELQAEIINNTFGADIVDEEEE